MEDRIVSTTNQEEDTLFDINLRPERLSEYLGQSKVKEKVGIFIEATKRRKEALDHVLLYGPPGLGKTTLAHIVANELGVRIYSTSGPVIERVGDLASILTNLNDRDVLFIDEIHRLNRIVEEYLYSAMEDYKIDIMIWFIEPAIISSCMTICTRCACANKLRKIRCRFKAGLLLF